MHVELEEWEATKHIELLGSNNAYRTRRVGSRATKNIEQENGEQQCIRTGKEKFLGKPIT